MKEFSAQRRGRDESFFWPPLGFFYSYGAVFLSVVLAGFFIYLHCTFALEPLARYYLPVYLRSELAESVKPADKYQLVFVLDDQREPRLVTPSDVTTGSTAQLIGPSLPFELSSGARRDGARFLWREAPRQYSNRALNAYLRAAVFDGRSIWQLFRNQLWMGLIALAFQLPFSIRKDVQRRQHWRYGRRLKGPFLVGAKEFSRALSGDGIGFVVEDQESRLRIPRSAENKHILTVGDTGAGKSTIIRQSCCRWRNGTTAPSCTIRLASSFNSSLTSGAAT